VLVTIGVITLVTGLSVTGITGRYDSHNAATGTLLNQLRLARMNAMTRGAHYRVTLNGNTHSLERLQDNDGDGEWAADTQVGPDVVELPDDVALSAEGGVAATGGLSVEFDTRGMLVVPSGATTGVVELSVTAIGGMDAGKVNRIEVWPSGQIQLKT